MSAFLEIHGDGFPLIAVCLARVIPKFKGSGKSLNVADVLCAEAVLAVCSVDAGAFLPCSVLLLGSPLPNPWSRKGNLDYLNDWKL